MRRNKLILTAYLLVLCVGCLATLGIFGQAVDAIEYTAKGLAKLAVAMNDAASAYYNIQSVLEELDKTHKELVAAYKTARNRFRGLWNAFKTSERLYEQAKAEMWAANDAWKAAENSRISAIGDINSANGRIGYCQHMLDSAKTTKMWEYWQNELKKAQKSLSDAKARKGASEKNKRNAAKAFRNARASMKIHKHDRDRWKKHADGAKRTVDKAKKAMDDAADELDAKKGEEVEAGKAHEKAEKEYYDYHKKYTAQQSGGGGN